MPRQANDNKKSKANMEPKKEALGGALSVHYAGESQYKTLALTENKDKEKDSGVPLPSARSIHEAKDFVDENEK